MEIAEGKDINIDSLISSNPHLYHTYVLAGNYCFARRQYKALFLIMNRHSPGR